MAAIERDGDDDADDREDHAMILARRQLLIATALCSVAVGAEGCDWVKDKLGMAPRVCLDIAPAQPCLQTVAPSACLNVAPQPCLEMMPTNDPASDAGAPQPCLEVAPTGGTSSDAGVVSVAPCLSPPAPRPRVCLSRTPRRAPAPMVCLSEELVNKRVDDEDEG